SPAQGYLDELLQKRRCGKILVFRQHIDNCKFAQQNQTAANTLSSAGLTLDEACKILNVSPPKAGQADLSRVHDRFKHLFDCNDPKKGGSFYLQSKVLRARERLEMEVREAQEAAEREQELREGWKPKLYRD
ncbi:Mitochondrial import inner membrane translocase subunit tim16, partial [Pseudocercospora fuligena]